MKLSIILPAKNEARSLETLLPEIRTLYPDAELIVVDDGSSDDTVAVCHKHKASVLSHPYSMGNGNAIKSGVRHASGDILVMMDADSQHNPSDIQALLDKLEQGYDMVVGARDAGSHASPGRYIVNNLYNRLSSWMVNHRIEDLTSGFRAVRAHRFREFLYLLPNGFSYPTTSTMAFFRAGYSVTYSPIVAERRIGKSHIRLIRDGVRFLLIIFKISTLYSPLKLFVPIAIAHLMVGLGYYAYTYSISARLSIMTVFMLTTSVIIFLIGLVSEQITQLIYRPPGNTDKDAN